MNTERLKNYSAYENKIIEFSQLKDIMSINNEKKII